MLPIIINHFTFCVSVNDPHVRHSINILYTHTQSTVLTYPVKNKSFMLSMIHVSTFYTPAKHQYAYLPTYPTKKQITDSDIPNKQINH